MRLTFPLLYRVLPFLQLMGPFDRYEQAETKARQLKQYRGWSELQQAVFQAGMEQKADGRWGSKFVAQARDEAFEDVLQVAGLTTPLTIPTLFVQPVAGVNRTEWQLRPYRTYLKQVQFETVPGNHWCFLVEPDAFNRAIATFLNHQ
jgi:pimeloyl-ACP methyl ester carboxylesterase